MKQLLIAFSLILIFQISPTCAENLTLKIFFTDNPNIDQIQEGMLLKNSLKKAQKNQLVHAGFIVSGFKPDKNGQLCLDLDIRIIGPDKRLLLAKEPFLRDKRIVKSDNGTIILNALLDFLIEDSDPAGSYTVSARLIDGNKRDYSLNNYVIEIAK